MSQASLLSLIALHARRYLHAQSAALCDVVIEYQGASAAGLAPRPLPVYAERNLCSPLPCNALDVNFELLLLYVRVKQGQRCSREQLGRMLRGGCYSPEPLDQLLAWLLLTVLAAAHVIQMPPDAADLVRTPSVGRLPVLPARPLVF